MMNFCFGYFGASWLRMSCIWVVPVMTMSHFPPETDSRLDFHWAGLLASDWMICVLLPAVSSSFMPRAASSKKPWSPSGPLTTFATDGLLAAAPPLPLAVLLEVLDDDDPQPASVTDTAARTAIPRERFFMGPVPFEGGVPDGCPRRWSVGPFDEAGPRGGRTIRRSRRAGRAPRRSSAWPSWHPGTGSTARRLRPPSAGPRGGPGRGRGRRPGPRRSSHRPRSCRRR